MAATMPLFRDLANVPDPRGRFPGPRDQTVRDRGAQDRPQASGRPVRHRPRPRPQGTHPPHPRRRRPERGTITLIVQAIGKTTKLLNQLGPGDAILDLVGPLSNPCDVRRFGNVVVIGGGAIAYPTAKAMREAGNTVLSILGGRTRDMVILEYEIRTISDEVFITTDDGSYGHKGLVVEPLKELIAAGRRPDLVLAIGPPRMMQAVAERLLFSALLLIVVGSLAGEWRSDFHHLAMDEHWRWWVLHLCVESFA